MVVSARNHRLSEACSYLDFELVRAQPGLFVDGIVEGIPVVEFHVVCSLQAG